MNDDDILFYTDVGCHLNKEAINRFYEYLDIVIDKGNLCFELYHSFHIEKSWTKSDLFNYFNVLNNKNITDTFQMMATSFLLLKNDVNLNIVNRWLQVYYDDFSLADDTPSKINNDATFIEHRHDQSIFSILSKIHNLYTIKSEIDFYGNQYYPIWALRDKKDIYSFIASEVSDSFIDKLVWYIPIRKIRNNVRYELKRYAIYSVKKYFGVLEKDNINIFNIKIIDNYLKNIINKKIEKHIKSNKTVKEIIDYINKYRKDIKILQ